MKEITVDAMIENMNTVTAFVDDFLDQIACPMKSRIQINIVIDEIFGNICHYAYKDSIGAVTVRVESGNTPKAVFLTFTDNGIPYNPLDTEDPDITLSSEERKIGGLGIYLVKKNMDEMKYEYVNQQNRLWMEKRL
ncbi:ATP-binding protein [Blautia sp. MSK17_66]|uniref:ATP-binding protein n=1 Tax=Blautia TaxID=572511 RepID=UPI00156F881E|nr:ATP-binding protein [Blautia sp. MSK17_66]MCB5551412.1 ATP-binding protein [Blautia sp. MSK17_66]NSK02933.1 ATP-binding protein [Blautia obeum]